MSNDFDAIRRLFELHSVGSGQFLTTFEGLLNYASRNTFPPYDIEKVGEYTDSEQYRVTMAVAGFGPDDIDVTVKGNMLQVIGRKDQKSDGRFLHKGIAERSFMRTLMLGDYVQVDSVDLENGILIIGLSKVVPVEKQPRKLEIGYRAQATPLPAQ